MKRSALVVGVSGIGGNYTARALATILEAVGGGTKLLSRQQRVGGWRAWLMLWR